MFNKRLSIELKCFNTCNNKRAEKEQFLQGSTQPSDRPTDLHSTFYCPTRSIQAIYVLLSPFLIKISYFIFPICCPKFQISKTFLESLIQSHDPNFVNYMPTPLFYRSRDQNATRSPVSLSCWPKRVFSLIQSREAKEIFPDSESQFHSLS